MVQAIHRRVWFNGTTSEVVSVDLDINTSFSIGVRFKTGQLRNAFQALVNKNDVASNLTFNYVLRINPAGLLEGAVSNNAGAATTWVTSTTRVDDGNWHYATLVWDRAAQTLTIYVDAMRDAAPSASACPYLPASRFATCGTAPPT